MTFLDFSIERTYTPLRAAHTRKANVGAGCEGTALLRRTRALSVDDVEGEEGDERHRSGHCSVEDPHADDDCIRTLLRVRMLDLIGASQDGSCFQLSVTEALDSNIFIPVLDDNRGILPRKQ